MTLQCPKCHKELFVESQDAATIEECPFCGYSLKSVEENPDSEKLSNNDAVSPSNRAWYAIKCVAAVLGGLGLTIVVLIGVLKVKWFGSSYDTGLVFAIGCLFAIIGLIFTGCDHCDMSKIKKAFAKPCAVKEMRAVPTNVKNRWQTWLVVKQVLSVVFGAWVGLVALVVVLKLKWFGDVTPFVMIGGLCGGYLFFAITEVVNECHEQYFVSSEEKLKSIQSAVEQSKKDYRVDRTYFEEHREEYVICKSCGNVFERGGVVEGVCRFVGSGIAGIVKYIVITIFLLLVSWFVNFWLFLCMLAICALGAIPYLFVVISNAIHSYSTNIWICPECGSRDAVPCNSFLGEKLVAERLKPFAKLDKELGIATGDVNSESSNTTSVKERLSALDELKRERMITDEEYAQKRSEVLKNI